MKHNASIMTYYYSTSAIQKGIFNLNDSFGTQQDSTLQDYIKASLMVQYNYIQMEILELAVIIKCTMHTNVPIKNNKIHNFPFEWGIESKFNLKYAKTQ